MKRPDPLYNKYQVIICLILAPIAFLVFAAKICGLF
jgi:hypothetical protein